MKNYENVPVYKVVINPAIPHHHHHHRPPEHREEEMIIIDEVVKSALKLENARKITLSGDIAGAALFDGTDDVNVKVAVKTADRALKDARGNDIHRTYAQKSDLVNLASKDDVQKKLNYLERVLHATKEAVNESLRESDLPLANESDIDKLF